MIQKKCFIPLLVFLVFFTCNAYQVRFHRLNNNKPIFDKHESDFMFNYNSAFLPLLQDGKFLDSLAVRVQDPKPGQSYYEVGPSKIVLAKATNGFGSKFQNVTTNNVILEPDCDDDVLGVEDPRIVYHQGTYYMFYTAVGYNGAGRPSHWGKIRAALALATTKTPENKNSWIKHGILFDDIPWSKSGALLIRDKAPHYLFWGDTDIRVATTMDLIHYTQTDKILIPRRDDHFDSRLCESGPPPMMLPDGNYLFIYNSARDGYPSPKPGYTLQYNFGFVILDKDDPTKVLQRSEQPLLSPVENWEKETTSTQECLTPNVIFTEGARPMGPEGKTNNFMVWYQGCDASMAIGRVEVQN